MNYSSKLLEDTVEALASLPSIGKKTALRLALHLVNDEGGKGKRISNSILEMKAKIKRCKCCNNLADQEECHICTNQLRKKSIICVVESVRDVMAIEETQQYNGVYHVLGGVISPLDGVGPEDIALESLVSRISAGEVDEIIMAISPSVEGETTIFYISKILQSYDVNISLISRGVSFGGELEYTDELTIARSIQSRIPYLVPQS